MKAFFQATKQQKIQSRPTFSELTPWPLVVFASPMKTQNPWTDCSCQLAKVLQQEGHPLSMMWWVFPDDFHRPYDLDASERPKLDMIRSEVSFFFNPLKKQTWSKKKGLDIWQFWDMLFVAGFCFGLWFRMVCKPTKVKCWNLFLSVPKLETKNLLQTSDSFWGLWNMVRRCISSDSSGFGVSI